MMPLPALSIKFSFNIPINFPSRKMPRFGGAKGRREIVDLIRYVEPLSVPFHPSPIFRTSLLVSSSWDEQVRQSGTAGKDRTEEAGECFCWERKRSTRQARVSGLACTSQKSCGPQPFVESREHTIVSVVFLIDDEPEVKSGEDPHVTCLSTVTDTQSYCPSSLHRHPTVSTQKPSSFPTELLQFAVS